MNKKELGLIILGYAAGVATGILAARGYFKKKYSKMTADEINAALDQLDNDSYMRRMESYKPSKGLPDPEPENVQSEKKGKREQVPTTDYTQYYESKEPEEEDDISEESTDQAVIIDEEAFEWHKKHIHKDPRILSSEDAGELPDFIDISALLYYVNADLLTDEDGEPIDQPYLLVGNALDKYNFRESDEVLIYVMNYQLDTCYEIHKMLD